MVEQTDTPEIDAWCELAMDADVSAVLELAKEYEKKLHAKERELATATNNCICVFCGSKFLKADVESLTNHILSCEKSPLVQMLNKAKGIIEEMTKTLPELEQELTEAKTKHNKVTKYLARFLVPYRTSVARTWLDGFVECGAVTIDCKSNPYGHVEPVVLA